jgi:signal peptidase I
MGKFIRGLLWTAGILAVVGGILRLTMFNVWTVPDDPTLAASVAPSLEAGDSVLMYTRGTPGFGDLVRCVDPSDAQRFVVGRVAGLEGDIIETEGRDLRVNSKTFEGMSSCPQPTVTILHPTTLAEVKIRCDVVEMAGGWHYRGFAPTPLKSTNMRREVGEGMLFLISDNRDYHQDSRDFGAVPVASCKERIVFRLLGKGGWSDDKSRFTYIH